MKPTLCRRCKKNVAVVFITRLDNNGQGSHNEGLCLKCARELNIRPVTDMIEKMGLSDEELEGLTNEMMSAFEGAESMEGLLGNLSGALSDAANGNDDDEEDGRTATFPFLNRLFSGGDAPQPLPHAVCFLFQKYQRKKRPMPSPHFCIFLDNFRHTC